jgi:putative DNA primase/helicase
VATPANQLKKAPPTPVSYDRKAHLDIATFADGVSIELRNPLIDRYGRLMVEVVARMGESIMHHATINLLDQHACFDYHQMAAKYDGNVDWQSYLLATIAPLQETLRGAANASASSTPEELASWGAPQPLPDPLPKVEPFEPKLLPEAYRPWIQDIAERMQCPMDFPAVSVMVATASVVGRKVVIRPKKHDDWRVVANLWGGVVGRPGVLKTPAIQEPLRPLWRLEYDADLTYQELLEQWKVQQVLAKEQEKVTSQQIRDTLKKGLDATSIAEALISSEECIPSRRRYIVNDSTVEKLGELLNENPNGLLVFRDELTGFLRQLDRDGHESDRAFYLEAWNGHGRFKYDRISRGTIDIEAACISILGGIQPGPLGHYLRSALQGGEGDDGLMQRFQLLVWPDISQEWVNVDRWPDSEARKIAYDVFSRLNTLTAADIGAQPDEDLDGIPYVHFSPEAQEIFDDWRAKLEIRLRQNHEHPALEAHLAKYRSLIPSLALLIHLADHGTHPVGVDAIERACAWGEYLESHARRVYSQGLAPDDMAARALADRILGEDLSDAFTARNVYRCHWAGLSTREEAQKGIDVLVELGWLAEVRETTGGRPSLKYVINPRVKEMSHDVA